MTFFWKTMKQNEIFCLLILVAIFVEKGEWAFLGGVAHFRSFFGPLVACRIFVCKQDHVEPVAPCILLLGISTHFSPHSRNEKRMGSVYKQNFGNKAADCYICANLQVPAAQLHPQLTRMRMNLTILVNKWKGMWKRESNDFFFVF